METSTVSMEKIIYANEKVSYFSEEMLSLEDRAYIRGVEENIKYYERRLDTLTTLQMTGQEKMIRGIISSLALKKERMRKQRVLDSIPELIAVKLSAEERTIWEAFLPTNYTRKELKHYNYDVLPSETISMYRECLEIDLFEQYEIRTPELKETDPALFGRLGESWYLLARWSETSLLTFEEIRERVKKTERVDFAIKCFFLFVILFFSSAGAYLGMWLGAVKMGDALEAKIFLGGIYSVILSTLGFLAGYGTANELIAIATARIVECKRNILYGVK